MKINREIVALRPQFPAKSKVGRHRPQTSSPRDDDDAVEMRVAQNNGRGGRFDDVGEMGIRKSTSYRVNCGRRQHHVADFAQPDEQNPFHSSIVASSMSMTGMSSLIGYTRLHVPHLSALPFLTSVTGVLHSGHARISSNSGSTAMRGIYDSFTLLWNNSSV